MINKYISYNDKGVKKFEAVYHVNGDLLDLNGNSIPQVNYKKKTKSDSKLLAIYYASDPPFLESKYYLNTFKEDFLLTVDTLIADEQYNACFIENQISRKGKYKLEFIHEIYDNGVKIKSDRIFNYIELY